MTWISNVDMMDMKVVVCACVCRRVSACTHTLSACVCVYTHMAEAKQATFLAAHHSHLSINYTALRCTKLN
jgi:hypothetical protein